MATRRTRIKGIANIPQRRKTLNNAPSPEDKPETDPEPPQKADTEPNLKFEPDGAAPAVKIEEKPNETGDTTDTSPVEKTKDDQKPAFPVRRKFIKPTVSVNAIQRKSKETEDVDQPKNKIVILDEIVSRPGQDQPVIINHRTAGLPEVAPAPPESQNDVNSADEGKRAVPSSPHLVTSDAEYPIPPPSPSKINRSRIKAVPRLGHRNTSYSASESEDESRRNYRHRNDSVCSSTSGMQDTNSIPECPSPQKPKEFNSVIQRKCRRTEQSRKLAEARRDFYMKFGHKKPDRQKLTMIDLIFYNPVTNPMSDTKKRNEDSENTEKKTETDIEKEEEEKQDDPKSDEENEIPAPQIKIGPQGELIVDEQSLVIENKSVKKNREELEKSELVNGNFETGYGVYKRAKRSKDWSKHETLKFYKALNTIGTDFALMCELFPRRSRRELKMKFKKEERVNKNLVDRAIMQPCGFDFTEFKHSVDMEEKELQEIEKQKEREREMKKEAKKRKQEDKPKVAKPKKRRVFDIMNVLEDSDADESEAESVDDENLMETIQKPTRSGRVPKVMERYKAPEPGNRLEKAKPGSLIVVASTGSNGQPVYKVCMVTGEHGRRQIGQDMSSLEKALQCKQNGIQDLFTLSVTMPESSLGHGVALPAIENNVTIEEPEEENNVTIAEPEVENNVTITEPEMDHNDVTIAEPEVEHNVTMAQPEAEPDNATIAEQGVDYVTELKEKETTSSE